MVKLWQKSLIAKVALKRGVQLTTSERMAEDIKVIRFHSRVTFNCFYINVDIIRINDKVSIFDAECLMS
jgi:hypothetical protein